MTRTHAQKRPSLRLVWDELLGVRVPAALRALGYRVTWIGNGDDGAPAKGSSDEAILEFAQRTNQVIVTSNHDMMLICHEAGQRFVWIDPYGKQLGAEQQVVLCFTQIRTWQELLEADPTSCVRALRTKCMSIGSDEAARIAEQRFRSLERKRRERVRRRPEENSASLQLVDGTDRDDASLAMSNAARRELSARVQDRYEDGITALGDPDLADQ